MIESIDRALAILQLFLQEEAPLSLTQISKKMGMHKSTVSRTLDTLEGRDFVRRDGETGLYWLGLQVYSLGMLFREKESFQKVAYPYAKALALQCKESVHMTTFVQSDAPYPQHVILEKIKSPQTVDMAPPIGAIRPSYCAASGKCLLARRMQAEEVYGVYDYRLGRAAEGAGSHSAQRLRHRAGGSRAGHDLHCRAYFFKSRNHRRYQRVRSGIPRDGRHAGADYSGRQENGCRDYPGPALICDM